MIYFKSALCVSCYEAIKRNYINDICNIIKFNDYLKCKK
jgi:hypothetical protein